MSPLAADRDETGGQMAEIVERIDIRRRPGDVFAYAAGFSHFPDWQGRRIGAPEGDGPLAVGRDGGLLPPVRDRPRRTGARPPLRSDRPGAPARGPALDPPPA